MTTANQAATENTGNPNLDTLRASVNAGAAPATDAPPKAPAKASKAKPAAKAKKPDAPASVPADSSAADAPKVDVKASEAPAPKATAKAKPAAAPKADKAPGLYPLRVVSQGKAGERIKVNPSQIKVDPNLNVRNMDSAETRKHIDWLKDQIKMHGWRSDVTIFPRADGWYLEKGHCRRQAVMELIESGEKIEFITAIPLASETPARQRLIEQFTENTDQRFQPVDQGRQFIRLMDEEKMEVDEIAKECGVSTTFVYNMVELVKGPAPVVEAVDAGNISASEAHQTLKNVGADKAPEVVHKAVEIAKAAGKSKATGKHVAEAIAKTGATVRTKTTRKSSGSTNSRKSTPAATPAPAPTAKPSVPEVAGDPLNVNLEGLCRLLLELWDQVNEEDTVDVERVMINHASDRDLWERCFGIAEKYGR